MIDLGAPNVSQSRNRECAGVSITEQANQAVATPLFPHECGRVAKVIVIPFFVGTPGRWWLEDPTARDGNSDNHAVDFQATSQAANGGWGSECTSPGISIDGNEFNHLVVQWRRPGVGNSVGPIGRWENLERRNVSSVRTDKAADA